MVSYLSDYFSHMLYSRPYLGSFFYFDYYFYSFLNVLTRVVVLQGPGGQCCDFFRVQARISAQDAAHLAPRDCDAFSKPMCEALVAVACAPRAGGDIDFNSKTYATSQAVVQAATYGHCSVAEAACELAKRLDGADTQLAADKIKGAMDSLKIAGEGVASTTQGVLAFIWAKVSNIAPKRRRYSSDCHWLRNSSKDLQ